MGVLETIGFILLLCFLANVLLTGPVSGPRKPMPSKSQLREAARQERLREQKEEEEKKGAYFIARFTELYRQEPFHLGVVGRLVPCRRGYGITYYQGVDLPKPVKDLVNEMLDFYASQLRERGQLVLKQQEDGSITATVQFVTHEQYQEGRGWVKI